MSIPDRINSCISWNLPVSRLSSPSKPMSIKEFDATKKKIESECYYLGKIIPFSLQQKIQSKTDHLSRTCVIVLPNSVRFKIN